MAGEDRVVVQVPARLDSSRLPGKQLRLIQGRPLLELLVERMRAVSGVRDLVIATTDRAVDEPLVKWAQDRELGVYRGAHEDVLGRLDAAARHFEADIVVRANGDNPLLAPSVTENGLAELADEGLEFVTGKNEYTDLPVGIGPELIRTDTLGQIAETTGNAFHREHVTTYIFENPDRFRWGPIPVDPYWEAPDLSVTVDTESDLDYVTDVVGQLPDRNPADWSVEEVIAACRKVKGNDSS